MYKEKEKEKLVTRYNTSPETLLHPPRSSMPLPRPPLPPPPPLPKQQQQQQQQQQQKQATAPNVRMSTDSGNLPSWQDKSPGRYKG